MGRKRNRKNATARNQSNKNGTTMADLPEVIVEEILLRLPVKSLLKFRCVSKSWRSLISCPEFVKTYHQLSSRRADFTNHRILIRSYESCVNLKQCSISSLMSKRPIVVSDVDYPSKSEYGEVKVVGSCNGIICLEIDKQDLFLWNPSTRKSKKLPPVDVELRKDFSFMWGFGYSELEDDYKVVGIFRKYRHVAGGFRTEIYSLRTHSWKRIKDFRGGIPYDDNGRFASGKLHFAANSSMDFYSRWNIVSLDLKTGAYGILEQPNYGEDCSNCYLRTIGGCLSVLCDRQQAGMDVWIMKEYGIKESWIRKISIPYNEDHDMFFYSNPLLIMPNGDILFVFRKSLVVFNPEKNYFAPRCNFLNSPEADIYVESLVSV